MGTLGDFTGGLMQGIQARDRMDLSRQYKRRLQDENDIADRDWQNYVNLTREQWGQEHGGDMSGFSAPARTPMKDPALLRFGKWLGTRMNFGGAEQPQLEEIPTSALPERKPMAGTMGPPQYADGGVVDDEERMKRSYGEHYLTDEEASARNDDYYARNAGMSGARPSAGPYRPGKQAIPTSGGGFGEFLKDMGRSAAGYFDDTQKMALAGNEEVEAAQQSWRDARGANQHGAALGDMAKATARASGATALGVAKDAFYDNPVGQFVGGMFGFDGGGDEQGVPTAPPPPADAAVPAPTQAAVEVGIDAPEKTDQQVADQAIQQGKELATENLDYQLLADQGVRPDELPTMTTRDWSDFRSAVFQYELGRGQGVKAAYEAMDAATTDMQMKGMMRELDKATAYLQTGQNEAAAMAVRQGFQYFPNGVNVKFGTATDPKTGQPALIAMGVDEETGEPAGKPMLITAERLAVIRENMSNPNAFRTWTKDGRDLQMQIAQQESLDSYREGSLDIARSNAITDRMEAYNDAVKEGVSGAMRYSDTDRRSADYREAVQEAEFNQQIPEGVGQSLADAMDRVTKVRPDLPPNVVIREVLSAWNTGGEMGVIELLSSLSGQ